MTVMTSFKLHFYSFPFMNLFHEMFSLLNKLNFFFFFKKRQTKWSGKAKMGMENRWAGEDTADCRNETEPKQEIKNNETGLSNTLIITALRYQLKHH